MSPEIPENPADAEACLLIQSAIGEALRISTREAVHEPLPRCFALLMLRIAFAQFVHDFAHDEAHDAGSDSPIAVEFPAKP
ncbi:hypothetical protein [Methylocystis echinoides]|uniref:Uncharacterized protein n=1 Tax=Methylocystis echinoides TaxID=29468 RepID=A0A9W6GSR9_9HYPH|nr:hypothetical protein [Methylocystis echinoides]GLI92366.1 hypothetical protein LMG27198_13580 [Methylocystis echinoides]